MILTISDSEEGILNKIKSVLACESTLEVMEITNSEKLNCKICSNSSLRNETYLPTVYRLLFSECTVGTEHPED